MSQQSFEPHSDRKSNRRHPMQQPQQSGPGRRHAYLITVVMVNGDGKAIELNFPPSIALRLAGALLMQTLGVFKHWMTHNT